MYLRQSDSAASLHLESKRKRDLLEHYEANVDEIDRWRRINAAYHEDDNKFMQFLIPPGKRVLELGCGHGDLLAALKPSYGVASISVPRRSPPRTPAIPISASCSATSRIQLLWRRSKGRSTTSSSPTPSACSRTSTARCG